MGWRLSVPATSAESGAVALSFPRAVVLTGGPACQPPREPRLAAFLAHRLAGVVARPAEHDVFGRLKRTQHLQPARDRLQLGVGRLGVLAIGACEIAQQARDRLTVAPLLRRRDRRGRRGMLGHRPGGRIDVSDLLCRLIEHGCIRDRGGERLPLGGPSMCAAVRCRGGARALWRGGTDGAVAAHPGNDRLGELHVIQRRTVALVALMPQPVLVLLANDLVAGLVDIRSLVRPVAGLRYVQLAGLLATEHQKVLGAV